MSSIWIDDTTRSLSEVSLCGEIGPAYFNLFYLFLHDLYSSMKTKCCMASRGPIVKVIMDEFIGQEQLGCNMYSNG